MSCLAIGAHVSYTVNFCRYNQEATATTVSNADIPFFLAELDKFTVSGSPDCPPVIEDPMPTGGYSRRRNILPISRRSTEFREGNSRDLPLTISADPLYQCPIEFNAVSFDQANPPRSYVSLLTFTETQIRWLYVPED